VSPSELHRARREVSVAGHCMQAGDEALERAQGYGIGFEAYRTANAMCAVLMWAFALEADVNHLLHRFLGARPDAAIEGDPTLEKAYWLGLRERIALYYKWVGVEAPDFGTRPFQVVSALKQVRDSIVHGKPHVAVDYVALEDGPRRSLPRSLQADWEPECTVDMAVRHRDDVLAVHSGMLNAAGNELGSPLEMLAVLSRTLVGGRPPTA
jgi:hypothetical protein